MSAVDVLNEWNCKLCSKSQYEGCVATLNITWWQFYFSIFFGVLMLIHSFLVLGSRHQKYTDERKKWCEAFMLAVQQKKTTTTSTYHQTANKNNVRWWFISTCCSSVACDLLFIRRKLMTHREERCAWLTHHFCSFYSGGILNFIFKIAVKYFAFSLFFSSRKNRKNFQSYYSRRRRSKQKWISSAAFEKSSVPDNNNGENSQMLFGRQYCYRQSRRITTTITMTMMGIWYLAVVNLMMPH